MVAPGPVAGSYSCALSRARYRDPSRHQHLARWAAASPCGARAVPRLPVPLRSRWPGRTVPRWLKCRCYLSPRHQHLARGQQRRRMKWRAVFRLPVAVQLPLAGSYSSALVKNPVPSPPATSTLPWAAASPCEAACGVECLWRPAPARRVIQFRAARKAASYPSPRHQHLAVGQQRRRVKPAPGARLPVAVQLPLAGSYSSALLRHRCHSIPLPPAPCHWAATSPCD